MNIFIGMAIFFKIVKNLRKSFADMTSVRIFFSLGCLGSWGGDYFVLVTHVISGDFMKGGSHQHRRSCDSWGRKIRPWRWKYDQNQRDSKPLSCWLWTWRVESRNQQPLLAGGDKEMGFLQSPWSTTLLDFEFNPWKPFQTARKESTWNDLN